MPLVSILMPAYNVSGYIRQCLDSVVSQSLTDIEIICIDDGSTDNTGIILDEYAHKDSRIHVIHKENTGYGHSMNLGLDAAHGEYIGIVETDDFIDRDMFKALYSAAAQSHADIVKSNFYNYYSYKDPADRYVDNFKNLAPYNSLFNPADYPGVLMPVFSIWSAIYKKQMLTDNQIRFNETPGASYQDTGFVLKSWMCASHVLLLKEAFLHYRRDNDQSSVRSGGKVFCVCDEFQSAEEWMQTHAVSAEIAAALINKKAQIYLWNYNRLAVEYKFAFLEKLKDVLFQARQNDLLNKDYHTDKNWTIFQSILTDADAFFKNDLSNHLAGHPDVQALLASYKKAVAAQKKLAIIEQSGSYRLSRKLSSIPNILRKNS